MDTTRRSFLRGALSLTILAATAPSIAAMEAAALPILYGDGIHDDTVALQAALDGKPFIVEGEVIPGAEFIVLKRGGYRISGGLRVTRPGTVIMGSQFHADRRFADYAVLTVPHDMSCFIQGVSVFGGEVGIHSA